MGSTQNSVESISREQDYAALIWIATEIIRSLRLSMTRRAGSYRLVLLILCTAARLKSSFDVYTQVCGSRLAR